MKRCLVLLLLLVAAACGRTSDDAAVPAPPVETVPILSGAQAYQQVCADCHEEGLNGAPQTGNREDWEGRSQLWQSVLFEHAQDGYLKMPARGGESSLDDLEVTKAAEYMLSITYPETRRN